MVSWGKLLMWTVIIAAVIGAALYLFSWFSGSDNWFSNLLSSFGIEVGDGDPNTSFLEDVWGALPAGVQDTLWIVANNNPISWVLAPFAGLIPAPWMSDDNRPTWLPAWVPSISSVGSWWNGLWS